VDGATLGQIVAALGGELLGDAGLRVERIATLESAGPSAIAFLAQERYRKQLETTRAGCVIVAEPLRRAAAARGAAIVTSDPYRYYAALTRWWAGQRREPVAGGIHPSAVVDATAQVAATASIGPLVVIEALARIGARCSIGPHCTVGRGAVVGDDTLLASNVSFGAGCRIGRRGIVHSGVVIGADGFGFAPAAGQWEKIEQLGAVAIGDDVEIGANTCIDRGALDDTVLEDGVKLDNLVQIGHNVHVGAHTAMAGCVGVAGSAFIGAHCTVGGGAVVLGHLRLADHVHISAASVVTRSILQPGQYSGVFPIDDNAAWEKNAATLRNLHALRERLRTLEKNLPKKAP
jgi:UDP-3-O-[3-hydroxymyristoyl] glucosamine N-acyltransferase